MLVEMSVANFRSIKDRQTLSLVRNSGDELLRSNTFEASSVKPINLLRSAVVYGANASGKSNFLQAIQVMDRFVRKSSGFQRGDDIPVVPFKLCPATRELPTEFEVVFIADGVRYQYGFSATTERVHEEWLFAFPKGHSQEWISRSWNSKTSTYEWGKMARLTGQKELWKSSTRDNALFLSTAVQLNSEQLKPVFDWFAITLRTVLHEVGPYHTAKFSELEGKEKVLRFLKAAGILVDDMSIERVNFDQSFLPDDMPESLKHSIAREMKDSFRYNVEVLRKDYDGQNVSWDLQEESDGTRQLFEFAGPWLDVLENGYVLFVDELHAYLHPHLVRFLVQLFHNPDTNPKNAQLIFTTHETSILTQELFRRDQVWFVEKQDYASSLYPLADFSPRKNRENIEQFYKSGRYGALPVIDDLFEIR